VDLLQESELTPTGSNLLDGRFAVFGYVVDNATLLADLQASAPSLLASILTSSPFLGGSPLLHYRCFWLVYGECRSCKK